MTGGRDDAPNGGEFACGSEFGLAEGWLDGEKSDKWGGEHTNALLASGHLVKEGVSTVDSERSNGSVLELAEGDRGPTDRGGEEVVIGRVG